MQTPLPPELAQLFKDNPNLDQTTVIKEYEGYRSARFDAAKAISFVKRRHGLEQAAAPSAGGVTVTDLTPRKGVSIDEVTIQTTFPGTYQGNKPLTRGRMRAFGKDVSYTAFVESFPGPGSTLRLHNVDVGTYKDQPQITIGRFSKVEVLKAVDAKTPVDVAIGELSTSSGIVNVEGRIVRLDHIVKEGIKPFYAGFLADATGGIGFTSWAPNLAAKQGDAVRFEAVGTEVYQGVLKLTLPDNLTIKPATKAQPELASLSASQSITLHDANHAPNTKDVQVTAVITEIRDGSGLVKKCTVGDCGRVLDAESRCFEHQKQTGTDDLRAKVIIDDGTGTAALILGRKHTEALLGKDLAACLAEAREAMDRSIFERQLADKLLGRTTRVTGYSFMTEYDTTFIAEDFALVNEDPDVLLARTGTAVTGLPGGPDGDIAVHPEAAPTEAPKAGGFVRTIMHRGVTTEIRNAVDFERGGLEKKTPNVLTTATGSRVNRVMLLGVLNGIEPRGDTGEMWVATLTDPTGDFQIRAGRYQPPAVTDFLSKCKSGTFVQVIGKVDSYNPEPGKVFYQVPVQFIRELEPAEYNSLVARCLHDAAQRVQKAIVTGAASDKAAQKLRYVRADIVKAYHEQAGTAAPTPATPAAPAAAKPAAAPAPAPYVPPTTSGAIGTVEAALKAPKGAKSVVIADEAPKPAAAPAPAAAASSDAVIDKVVAFVKAAGDKGCSWDDVANQYKAWGVSSTAVEDAINKAQDRHLIHEPTLGTLRA